MKTTWFAWILIGVLVCLGCVSLLTLAPRVPRKETQVPVTEPTDKEISKTEPETVECRSWNRDECSGKEGLTEDQIIFGYPPSLVSGTYTDETPNSTGWVDYTDAEHGFNISFIESGFDSDYFIHFYPSGSDRIDTEGCVTTSEQGIDDPEGMYGHAYIDEKSTSSSHIVNGATWCETTLKRFDSRKTENGNYGAFSTPVTNGHLVVYFKRSAEGWPTATTEDLETACDNVEEQYQEPCGEMRGIALASYGGIEPSEFRWEILKTFKKF